VSDWLYLPVSSPFAVGDPQRRCGHADVDRSHSTSRGSRPDPPACS